MHRLASFAVVSMLTWSALAVGQDCVIEDDFSDGTISGPWQAVYINSGMSISEYGGWVRFPGSSNNGDQAIAICLSSEWELDLTHDFYVTAQWYSAPPWPDEGDVGIAMALLPDFATGSGHIIDYGYSVSVGRYNSDYYGEWSHYSVCSQWSYDSNSQYAGPDYTYTATSGTMHVRYDASADTLTFGDSEYDPDPWVVHNFRDNSPSGATSTQIGFGGYSFGYVPAISSNKLCGTNFCIDEGVLVGSAVGACCIGDTCIETIAFSCDGQWQGAGTDCEVCFEEPCQGDIDGNGDVGTNDLLALIAYWATDEQSCDLDGSGSVGVIDLLILMELWGTCD